MQAPLELRQAPRQLLRTHAMAPRRAVQRFDARFRLAQRLRVELDAGGIVAKLAYRLVRLRVGRFEHLDDRREMRIVLREMLQLRGNGAQLRERRPFGFSQGLERRLRSGEQARAMLKPLV